MLAANGWRWPRWPLKRRRVADFDDSGADRSVRQRADLRRAAAADAAPPASASEGAGGGNAKAARAQILDLIFTGCLSRKADGAAAAAGAVASPDPEEWSDDDVANAFDDQDFPAGATASAAVAAAGAAAAGFAPATADVG